MYRSTLSLTSALDGVGDRRHVPTALPPEKSVGLYPLNRRLGGPQDRSGRVRKISPPTGNRSPERSARGKSLYRLSHLGTFVRNEDNIYGQQVYKCTKYNIM
jgi:hypothetical protein